MLLVDSVYVNYGGALSLLHYLVDTLVDKNIKFCLLADARCKDMFDGLSVVSYIDASEKRRKAFYLSKQKDFSSVFCFGNVPPPIRLKVPVYTYFHNINMLTLADCRDRKQLLKFWLKRAYIKVHRKNTDEWFVQTSNTATELTKHLGVMEERVKLYPFYKLPVFPISNKPRTDYIFVGEYSGSKGHTELLEAWKLLHKQGVDLILHLTVSLGDEFLQELNTAIEKGVKIINHGFISVGELAGLYMQCKATVYPSYNESFGLGLVEAMEAGCDVIASDRLFVHAICEPSKVFEPASPSSIAETIMAYENGSKRETKLLVKDMVNEMIYKILHN